jgi:hypothetical protein
MVVAEARHQPDFGRQLYETGFLGAERVLQDYLARQVEAGQLKTHDVGISTRVFMDLDQASAVMPVSPA